MTMIEVNEPVKVHTGNSVYLVEPAVVEGRPLYKATKIEGLRPGKHSNNAHIGKSFYGDILFLDVGRGMRLGDWRTGNVVKIEYVEPQH